MEAERKKKRLRKEKREEDNRKKLQNMRPLKGGKGQRKDPKEYLWPCFFCNAEISNKSKVRHWRETKRCRIMRGII